MHSKIEVYSVKNIASDIELLKRGDIAEVTNITDETVTLFIDVNMPVGLLVSLRCGLHFGKQSSDFHATGVVLASRQLGNKYCLDIKLRQYSKEAWHQVITRAVQEQNRIDELFLLMKG